MIAVQKTKDRQQWREIVHFSPVVGNIRVYDGRDSNPASKPHHIITVIFHIQAQSADLVP